MTAAPDARPLILALDDNESFGPALVRMLERAGYRAAHCVTVAEAVRRLEAGGDAGEIALLLIDINLGLGEVGGLVVADTIALRWPRVRTAVMSGYSRKDYGAECPEGLPFLEKPLAPDSVAEQIQAILDAPPYHPST